MKKIIYKRPLQKLEGFSFLSADIDGLLRSLFHNLLFVQMWQSLVIRFEAINLKALLVVDNTMLCKFAYLSKRWEQFWSGSSYNKFYEIICVKTVLEVEVRNLLVNLYKTQSLQSPVAKTKWGQQNGLWVRQS